MLQYIVEAVTTTGTIVERYATYEEAAARLDRLPAENLVGMAFIFRELPDGSVRLVRSDGKPLQWHRLEGRDRDLGDDEPLPLSDELPEAAGCEGPAIRVIEPHRDEDEEPPIPLVDGP